MASLKRVLSSRANGAKSRGPVTRAGKYRSSLNAVSHGVLARCCLLDDEEGAEGLRDTYTDYVTRLQPADGVEHGYVQEMVSAHWRLRRLWAIENRTLEQEIAEQRAADSIDRMTNGFHTMAMKTGAALLHRYEMRLHLEHRRALQTLLLLRDAVPFDPRARRRKPPRWKPPSPAAAPDEPTGGSSSNNPGPTPAPTPPRLPCLPTDPPEPDWPTPLILRHAAPGEARAVCERPLFDGAGAALTLSNTSAQLLCADSTAPLAQSAATALLPASPHSNEPDAALTLSNMSALQLSVDSTAPPAQSAATAASLPSLWNDPGPDPASSLPAPPLAVAACVALPLAVPHAVIADVSAALCPPIASMLPLRAEPTAQAAVADGPTPAEPPRPAPLVQQHAMPNEPNPISGHPSAAGDAEIASANRLESNHIQTGFQSNPISADPLGCGEKAGEKQPENGPFSALFRRRNQHPNCGADRQMCRTSRHVRSRRGAAQSHSLPNYFPRLRNHLRFTHPQTPPLVLHHEARSEWLRNPRRRAVFPRIECRPSERPGRGTCRFRIRKEIKWDRKEPILQAGFRDV